MNNYIFLMQKGNEACTYVIQPEVPTPLAMLVVQYFRGLTSADDLLAFVATYAPHLSQQFEMFVRLCGGTGA